MLSAKLLRHPASALIAVALASTPVYAAPARRTPAPASASPCILGIETGPVVKLAVGNAKLLNLQDLKLKGSVTRILLGNPENAQAVKPSAGPQNATGNQGNAGNQGAPAAQQNAHRPGVADVDVLLLSPTEIYLLGKTVGSTNIAMLDRTGQCTMFNVVVGMDTAALAATLKELLPLEGQIKVSSAADSLVLSGMVSDATVADSAVDIAGAYVRKSSGGASTQDQIINLLSIAAPQQVMLEVKVAEISKALLDQFGINFSRAYAASDGSMMRFLSGVFGGNAMLGGQLTGMTGATVGLGLADVISGGSSASGISAPAGSITAANGSVTQWPIAAGKSATTFGIDAQKQDGLLKILAEPTVMAISGQEGSFLAGGKIYLPVATNNGSGGTSITLEEKEFGVSLKFTPTVLGDGRINLKVSPEVSELNTQGVAITATNVAGTAILPSFNTRRASTTVQLMDGQSFAIGGLIKNNVTANLTAFPFLGEIPVLGALFRSTSYQNDRSELVFVITPRLVKPLPPNYALPTDGFVPPTRSDMILHGRLEGEPANAPAALEAPLNPAPAAPSSGGFEVK